MTLIRCLPLCFLIVAALGAGAQSPTVWPAAAWPIGTPESQGLTTAPFDALDRDIGSGVYGNVDRLLVIDIKDSSRVLTPLSHDLNAAKDAILATSAAGSTAIYNGLYLTLKEMTRQRQPEKGLRRQALVLLSDGDDTTSIVAYDDVMELAKQAGISIYTIMLRSSHFDSQIARRNPESSKSEY